MISVKISTIYSQISPLAREHTIAVLCDRLELLYREAARAALHAARMAQSVPKFVYLDMEEYRDLELTAEAFMRTLDRPGLEKARAPASRCRRTSRIPPRCSGRINEWARTRVARGRRAGDDPHW